MHVGWGAAKQTETAHVMISAVIVKLTNGLGTMEGIRVNVSMQTDA